MKIPVRSERDGMPGPEVSMRKGKSSSAGREMTGREARKGTGRNEELDKYVLLDTPLVRKWHIIKGWKRQLGVKM